MAAAALALSSGCFLVPPIYEVETPTATEAANKSDEPPVKGDRPEHTPPGHIWVNGHYNPNPDGTWSWQRGYFQPDRPGFLWVQGDLEQKPDGRHVWREGYWMPKEGFRSGPR